ncbi:hypothetical protein [Micromonospora qiuiae]|nr:hypothetical protein [Micromonospora qiuiae]
MIAISKGRDAESRAQNLTSRAPRVGRPGPPRWAGMGLPLTVRPAPVP